MYGGGQPPPTSRRKMLIQTTDKMDAASSILELLLQDTRKYCNFCGADYKGLQCCESPQIGSHYEHLIAVVKQNKAKQHANDNAYGSSKHIRHALAIPPILFNEWNNLFLKRFNEKLLDKPKDMHDMMRRFPFLKTCERV